MDADGSDRHRLYHSRAGVGTWSAPQWSPDGKRIAFSADTAEGLVVMNPDGSGRELFFRNASNFAWQPLK
jgi:Tol biopolymer transport system component